MSYNQAPLTVAVAHRFMVDSLQASPLMAVRLMRRFFAGPQDLSIGDGANDQGMKFWTGCGGQVSWLYSIDWFKPLCPASYFLTIITRKKHKGLRVVLPPFRGLVRGLERSALRLFGKSHGQKIGTEAQTLNPETLLECIRQFSAANSLAPVYNLEEMQWLWRFMEQNNVRGKLQGCRVKDAGNKTIGCFLYYHKKDGIAEIMLLCAAKDKQLVVYDTLINHLRREKAIGLIGRMVPDFMQALGQDKVFFKRGSWALIHAKCPELLEAINAGNVFLSSLEGELCLYAPIEFA